MVSETRPYITENGLRHAYKALALLDDLIREVMLVQDEMGYMPQALAVKRSIAKRDRPALSDLRDRLNRITLHDVER